MEKNILNSISSQWQERTAQQLVMYEALFNLLDKIQPLEDVKEICQHVARQWKYIANVAAWHLVIKSDEKYFVIDGYRGQSVISNVSELSPWDSFHYKKKVPTLLSFTEISEDLILPENLDNKSISQIYVIPFIRLGYCIGLLTVAARHADLTELDKKFIHMFGSYFVDKIFGIFLRQQDMNALLTKATYDDLTGALNRGAIIDYLDIIFPVSKRTSNPISIIIADIDHFKEINDTYGHLAGDTVLRILSLTLQNAIREKDNVGRYGGEEFLFVLYPCDSSHAVRTAERIRIAVESKKVSIDTDRKKDINVTISLGVASIQDTDKNIEEIISRADRALYRSKENGRNRSTFAED